MPTSKRQAAVVSHTLRLCSDSDDQKNQAASSNSSSSVGVSVASRQSSAGVASQHVTSQLPTLRKPIVQSMDGLASDAAVQASRQALPRLPDAAAPKLRPIRTTLPPQKLPPNVTSAASERQRRVIAKTAAAIGGPAVGRKPSGPSGAPRSVSSEGSRGRQASVLLSMRLPLLGSSCTHDR